MQGNIQDHGTVAVAADVGQCVLMLVDIKMLRSSNQPWQQQETAMALSNAQ